MRVVPDDFSKNFKGLLQAGAIDESNKDIKKHGTNLGYLEDGDPEELIEAYTDICTLITEPFRSGPGDNYTPEGGYLWKTTDLPKRVTEAAKYIAKNFKLRTPPREAVFLDRKLGGAFIFLSVIGFQANTNKWLKETLKKIQ